MAYYCEVTDLTRPRPAILLVHYSLIDDTDNEVLESGTHGFRVYEGETLNQVKQRLKAETDAYFASIITDTQRVDTAFEELREMAIGYRYPAS